MKSIYEVALNILIDSLQDPQDEDNVCYMLNLLQMNVIIGALQQAQKQEKLLELYIKIYNGITDYHDYDELKEIQKQIKELENEE